MSKRICFFSLKKGTCFSCESFLIVFSWQFILLCGYLVSDVGREDGHQERRPRRRLHHALLGQEVRKQA